MFTEEGAKKRLGRFIKKGSPVLKKVSLSEFNFDEISNVAVVDMDNPDRSIIHSRMQTPETLDGIKRPDKFDDDLMPDSQRRPLLRPINFTKQWELERKRQKERVVRPDDDDIYDDFDTPLTDEPPEMGSTPNLGQSPDDHPGVDGGENPVANPTNMSSPAETEFQAPPSPDNAGSDQDVNFTPMDVVGDAIKNLQSPESEQVAAAIDSERRAADQGSAVTESQSPPPATDQPESTTEPESTEPERGAPTESPAAMAQDEFIPAQTSAPEGGEPHDPEQQAAEIYQERMGKLDEVFEEAKSRGYQAGFQVGEEKAALQAQEKTAALFGKVGELIHEFSRLKRDVLNNVQENFYEINQAIAETLLRREFSIDPQTFASVIRKAIKDAVKDDAIKIKVNSATFSKISDLSADDLSSALEVDDSVTEGDFKLEAGLNVVDGNIREIVRKLLDSADIQLFQSEPMTEQDASDTDQEQASNEQGDDDGHDKAG